MLDNCEHLIEAAAGARRRPARGLPGVRILATSREPLAIAGERLLAVAPLGLPEARRDGGRGARAPLRRAARRPRRGRLARLRRRRRQRRRRGRGLPAARRPAARDRARRRPAALAVGRADRRPARRPLPAADRRQPHGAAPPAHAARGDRLELGPARRRRAPARRPPRRVPRRRHRRESAAAVARRRRARPARRRSSTARCCRSSTRARRATGCSRRCASTAIERLEEAGELDAVRTAHARHFAALAEEADPHLRAPEQLAWLGRLVAERDNLTAALRWLAASGDARRGAADGALDGLALARHRRVRRGQEAMRMVADVPGEADPADRLIVGWFAAGDGRPHARRGAREARRVPRRARGHRLHRDAPDRRRRRTAAARCSAPTTTRTSRLFDRARTHPDPWVRASVPFSLAQKSENDGEVESTRDPPARGAGRLPRGRRPLGARR